MSFKNNFGFVNLPYPLLYICSYITFLVKKNTSNLASNREFASKYLNDEKKPNKKGTL